MRKNVYVSLGVLAIAFAYVMSLNYAANDYGIVKNSLSLHVLANGSSGSGSGSSEGESGSTSEETSREKACKDAGNSWNFHLKAVSGGVVSDVLCNIGGELTLLGQTIKGNYVKGSKYTLGWALFSCETDGNNGNCCERDAQGVRLY